VIGNPMIKYPPVRDNIREPATYRRSSRVLGRKHYRPGVGKYFLQNEMRYQTWGQRAYLDTVRTIRHTELR
jgi:hypothetical protein